MSNPFIFSTLPLMLVLHQPRFLASHSGYIKTTGTEALFEKMYDFLLDNIPYLYMIYHNFEDLAVLDIVYFEDLAVLDMVYFLTGISIIWQFISAMD